MTLSTPQGHRYNRADVQVLRRHDDLLGGGRTFLAVGSVVIAEIIHAYELTHDLDTHTKLDEPVEVPVTLLTCNAIPEVSALHRTSMGCPTYDSVEEAVEAVMVAMCGPAPVGVAPVPDDNLHSARATIAAQREEIASLRGVLQAHGIEVGP